MRFSFALVAALLVAACAKPKQQDPYAPRPDDIPTALTCCVAVDAAGNPTTPPVKEEECPEENRNPLDTWDLGPGEAPRPN